MSVVARGPRVIRRFHPGLVLPGAAQAASSSPPTSAFSPSDAAEAPSSPPGHHKQHDDAGALDFEDTGRLFASMPTGKLVRSLANLYAMACDPLVDLGIAAMRSSLAAGGGGGAAGAAVMAAAKATVYRHFCAGEGVEEAGRTLEELCVDGLRGILDYSLEDAESNAGCDANLAEFLRIVEVTPRLPPGSVSFACVKVSAICPVGLLERIGNLLRWEQRQPPASVLLPWRRHSLPVLAASSPLYRTPAAPPPLDAAEEHDLRLAHRRLRTLCARCAEFELPLLVDGEYTSIQPAIDYFAFDAAAGFNRAGTEPVVYGTIQAYLRDAMDRLVLATGAADRAGVPMGFKLVRGAYMTTESRVAASVGAPSPIHPGIDETHACYNRCAFFMLERAARGTGSVVLATHNLESGKAAAAKVAELGMGKGSRRVQFAQLKGMAEGLSLGLRGAGFNVSKYLPYGPVEKVMPYLVRRAEENRGLLSASSLDRLLLRRELKRRLGLACGLL